MSAYSSYNVLLTKLPKSIIVSDISYKTEISLRTKVLVNPAIPVGFLFIYIVHCLLMLAFDQP